jgi:hypothetical protein
MTDELARLDSATSAYKRTETAHEKARTEAVEAVIAALLAGHRPAEVARRSPFTDAYIRKLARQREIPPDERYVRTRSAE